MTLENHSMGKETVHAHAGRVPAARALSKDKRRAGPASPQRKKTSRGKPGELRRDEAVAQIRQRILDGSLGFRSRDILTETQLTRQLGLTLNPVRQALSQLANEGLVEILPRVGTQVRVVRPEEAQAIMAMRFAIETVIVGDLARTRPDLSDLWTIHDEMERLADLALPLDPSVKYDFAKADMDFHAKMAELAKGYGTAARTLRDLTSQFLLYAYHAIPPSEAQMTMTIVNKQHKAILKAVEECKGDPTVPRRLIQEHIQSAVDRLTPFASSYLRNEVHSYLGMKN
jgi:DNA-binding GntR family transcriptional regulator